MDDSVKQITSSSDVEDVQPTIVCKAPKDKSAGISTDVIPKHGTDDKHDGLAAFPLLLGGLAAGLLVLFCGFVRFDAEAQTDQHVQQYYMWYIHVAIMVFVGFGFLMTFLRRYSYSAVALNFLTSCLVFLEAIIMIGFAQQQLWGHAHRHIINLDLPLLIDAAFCAASAMISFGAVIGKTSAVQILVLLAIEVPIYAANQQLIMTTLGVLDIGGSITIHVFGAYYGLAASMSLSKYGMGTSHHNNKPSYFNDITAMIGTLFLWIYWPSFNGALASDPETADSAQQFNCVVNTILSLSGACLATFVVSTLVTGKCDMMHVQNATLAGGVAMGTSANLGVSPGFALGVGLIAGTLSTLGFTHIGPWLEARIGLRDTCGVHNLHGMPGLLAALVSAVASAWAFSGYGELMAQGKSQPGYQVAGALVSLAVASTSGTLAGMFVDRVVRPRVSVNQAFEDGVFWHGVEVLDVRDVSISVSKSARRLPLSHVTKQQPGTSSLPSSLAAESRV